MLKLIYEKIRNGDTLSNDEITLALHEFKKAAKVLEELGEKFHFSYIELKNRIYQLEDWKEARARTKND